MPNSISPTPGEHFLTFLWDDEAQRLDKFNREASANSDKAQADLQEIAAFLDSAWSKISETMASNSSSTSLVIGQGRNSSLSKLLGTFLWYDPSLRLDDPRHRFFPVWEQFAGRCKQKNLVATIFHKDSSGETESWSAVTVSPSNNAGSTLSLTGV